MKKSLLAVAVIATLGTVAGAASAQSNVTIYGVADAGFQRFDDGDDTFTRLQSGQQSGSRIGFRGVEDLGGGLSAIFTLENGFSIDTGGLATNNVLFSRQAFVGLQGGFGAIKLGRQYAPIRTAVESIDPFGLGLAGSASSMFNLHGERTNNTLNYTTANFGGFTGQLAYSFGEQSGSTSLGRHLGLSAGYAAGPLNVIFAYHDQNRLTTAGADDGEERTSFLGGSYNLGMAKLHAGYSRSEREDAASGNFERDDAMLGVSANVGAGTVMASFTRRSDDAANRDADMWALGYTHPLSKRTNLYTSYARIKNDGAASAGFGSSNPAASAGRDPSIFNVGVRHRF